MNDDAQSEEYESSFEFMNSWPIEIQGSSGV